MKQEDISVHNTWGLISAPDANLLFKKNDLQTYIKCTFEPRKKKRRDVGKVGLIFLLHT